MRQLPWTPRLNEIRADGGCDSPALADWCQQGLQATLSLTQPAPQQKGFVVQRGRWAERVFEELRRAIEGQVYPSLQAKQLAIEHHLRPLRANKSQLRHLIGWDWIRHAFEQLPDTSLRRLFTDLV